MAHPSQLTTTLELLAALLAPPPATTAADAGAARRPPLAVALAAELGAAFAAAAPAALDEATAGTAATAAQWLAGTLRQARAPPVLEAWHDAGPLLVSAAAACAGSCDGRAPVLAALLLHEAAGHPSPLVRRLALVSHLALVQRCLDDVVGDGARDGDGAASAVVATVQLLACTFARATAEPCEVSAAVSSAAASAPGAAGAGPQLHDDASLVDATAMALHALLASPECGAPPERRLEAIHGVALACAHSGSVVLALSGLCGGGEAGEGDAAAPAASAAVTAAAAAAREARTSLSPLPPPSAALLAALFTRCAQSSVLAQAAGSGRVEDAAAVLRHARRLSALVSLLRSLVLPRLPAAVPLPLPLRAGSPAAGARYTVAEAVCGALLHGPLTTLLAAAPAGETFGELRGLLRLTTASLVAAPLSPPTALARAVAFGADCAPPSTAEAARAAETAAWLRSACEWAGACSDLLRCLLLLEPSAPGSEAALSLEAPPLLVAVAAEAGVGSPPQLLDFVRCAPLSALPPLVQTLTLLGGSDAISALIPALSARVAGASGSTRSGDAAADSAAAAELRLWMRHARRDEPTSPPATVTLSGALAEAVGGAGVVFDAAQPHAWAHAAGRLAGNTATPADVSALLGAAAALAADPRAASAAADASATALAAAAASGSPLDAGAVPMYGMLAALAHCVRAAVTPRPGQPPQPDGAPLAAALLGAACTVAALPSGAVRVAGLRALSAALFSGDLWARLTAAAAGSTDVQRAACDAPDGLLRAAEAALVAVTGDDGGLGAPGCGAGVGAVAGGVVPTLRWLVAAAGHSEQPGALALLQHLTASAGDERAPPLLSLLQRLAVSGEHAASAAHPVCVALDGAPSSGLQIDDATPAGAVRAAAASVLALAFTTAVVASAGPGAPAAAPLDAFLPVGLRAETEAAAAASSSRAAPRPGTPAVTRLMRRWQAAATLLTAAVHCMAAAPAASAPPLAACLSDASRLFRAAAVAPLPGCVRQYVEVALGAWLAAVSSARVAAPPEPPLCTAHALTYALFDCVRAGEVPATTGAEAASFRRGVPPISWSNATLLLTALTVAHELLPLLDEGGKGKASQLPPSLHRLLDVVVLLAATCQRHGVRETAQCCLLRLAARLPLGCELVAGKPSLLADVIATLESNAEALRTVSSQPTVLRPETGELLHLGSDTAAAVLLYSLLPIDDAIPASESAAADAVMPFAVLDSPAAMYTSSVRDAVAHVSQGIVSRQTARQEEANRQRDFHKQHHERETSNDDDGDPASLSRTTGRSLRQAQAIARYLQRTVISERTPLPVLAAALPQLNLRQTKAGGRSDDSSASHANGRSPLVRIHHRLTLVASLLRKPTNLGAVLRAAEALAPSPEDNSRSDLVVTTALPVASVLANQDVSRSSVGASKRVADMGALRMVTPRALPAFLAAAVRDGARVVALELTTGSIPLPDFRFVSATAADASTGAQHTVLLLGDEVDGVPAALLGGGAVSAAVAIPQSGDTASLNVASAAAVALYEFARQVRASPAAAPTDSYAC